MGREIIFIGIPKTIQKIIKSADTWGVFKLESTENSIKREQIPTVTIPVLNKIPLIGELFEDQSPYLYMMVFIVAFSWYMLYRTKTGLRLRTIGDHPKAAATAGVNVSKYRYISVIICGMLCGLAGSYLSIVQSNLFVKEMVAGRGYISLAATIFGGWNPVGSFLASIRFSVLCRNRKYFVQNIKCLTRRQM